MRLPNTPEKYLPSIEAHRNRAIELADKQNHKRNQDVEVGQGRLIITSPDGTRYSIEVDNSGNLSASAV